jgi:hypothetical protein
VCSSDLLTHLSQRPGWFQPVSTLLDYLVEAQHGTVLLGGYRLFRLEALWFWHRIRGRHKHRAYEQTQSPYLKCANEQRAGRSR